MMPNKKSDKMLLRYAGMGAQFAGATIFGLYVGGKIDKWIHLSFPLVIWLLPLLLIIGMLIKIVIDTSNKEK